MNTRFPDIKVVEDIGRGRAPGRPLNAFLLAGAMRRARCLPARNMAITVLKMFFSHPKLYLG